VLAIDAGVNPDELREWPHAEIARREAAVDLTFPTTVSKR
jgi:hypothetical protein